MQTPMFYFRKQGGLSRGFNPHHPLMSSNTFAMFARANGHGGAGPPKAKPKGAAAFAPKKRAVGSGTTGSAKRFRGSGAGAFGGGSGAKGRGFGGPPPAPPARPLDAPLLDPEHPALEALSVCQRQIVAALVAKQHVFLTGRAGSGKSMTMQAVIAAMQAAGTYLAVTAASGLAAAPLKGVTLHSWMCINEAKEVGDNIKKARLNRPELATLQVLMIDEVSMVSAEVMQRVVDIFRAVRSGHPVPPLPVFILVGDFKQLPPVKGTLLLNSPLWNDLKLKVVVLTDNFRQAGQPEFLALLDEAGMGALTPESAALLRSRVGVSFADTHDVRPTVLVPRRRDADVTNVDELQRLLTEDNPKRVFRAKVQHLAATDNADVPFVPVAGCADQPPPGWAMPDVMAGAEVFVENSPGTWVEVSALAASCLTAGVFECALGAQVVFTTNVDPPRVVNGTRGVVTGFNPYPVVTLACGAEVAAAPFVINRRVHQHAASPIFRVQFVPLKLAWALTIHSAQGMSIDYAEIDLGRDVFSVGQGYVALSRLRTLQGLSLRQFHPGSIRADPEVVKWYLDNAEPTEDVFVADDEP